jgi:hypothetical protein
MRESFWELFTRTGDIDCYLAYAGAPEREPERPNGDIQG